MGDQTLLNCMKLNELLRDKMRKQHMQQTEGAAAGPTANEDDRNNRIEMQNMLLSMIKKKKRFLEFQGKIIEACEKMDDEEYVASLLLLPSDCSDKIHRAEAALERRLYKALDRLLALPKSNASLKSIKQQVCEDQ